MCHELHKVWNGGEGDRYRDRIWAEVIPVPYLRNNLA